jgi:hypothetical protein
MMRKLILLSILLTAALVRFIPMGIGIEYPEYYKDGLILIQSPGLSILNLKSNSFFEIGEKSELHFVGGFFKTKPWFFYSRMITENSMPETVIL